MTEPFASETGTRVSLTDKPVTLTGALVSLTDKPVTLTGARVMHDRFICHARQAHSHR